jgi:transaldolase
MVGADVCVTINWKGSAEQFIEEDPPVIERFFNPVPDYVVEELLEKMPDFRLGYEEGAIKPHEYEHFGPVIKFRDSFLKDWTPVLEEAEKRLKNR